VRKWLRSTICHLVAGRHISHKSTRTSEAVLAGTGHFYSELSDLTPQFVMKRGGSEVSSQRSFPLREAASTIHFGGVDITKEIVYHHNGYELRKRFSNHGVEERGRAAERREYWQRRRFESPTNLVMKLLMAKGRLFGSPSRTRARAFGNLT
jgi:hypothetical protein